MNPLLSDVAKLKHRAQTIFDGLRRRARKAGITLDYNALSIRFLLENGPQCFYCRMPVSYEVTLDHKVPLDRGGSHGLGNLVVCCPDCNLLKGLMDDREFVAFRDFLDGRLHPKARADLFRRLKAGGRVYDGKPKTNRRP